MQAAYHSDSVSGASDVQEAPLGETGDVAFTITAQDAQILQHYLEDFQPRNTSVRTELIDRIMGELYRLRPVNTPFDKKDAKQVLYLSAITSSKVLVVLSYGTENPEVVL
jgi:hypothetical protein